MIEWNKYIKPMLANDDLKNALYDLPAYDESNRNDDVSIRLMKLSDIYKIYVPSVMTFEIYHKLYMSMMISLQKKETKEAILQQKNNFLRMRDSGFRGIIGGCDSFTIIGKSGIGKSSAIERAVSLITGNELIHIDTPLLVIIPILQVQCPFDCSAKALLLEILKAVDDRTGSNYYRSGTRNGVTTDSLIGLVGQVCLNHVGVLIIDEIQNVVKNKKGGTLIGMLMQLINSSGIGIAMVGTPESAIFFESEMQLARRSVGLSYDTMDYGEQFIELCSILFRYQYVKQKTELTDEIIDWLYEHTQGVVALAVTLIHDAQEIAIIHGLEILDKNTLSMAYSERLGMLHDRISCNKKRKPQTSRRKSIKENIEERFEAVPDDLCSLVDIVDFCKKNNLDAVEEISKYASVEVVSV